MLMVWAVVLVVFVVAGLEVVTDVAVLAAFGVEATGITTSDKSEAIV